MKSILASDLNKYHTNILSNKKCLSLDCFDTLFWRKVVAPIDIFFELANHELFKDKKISAYHRIDFEKKARHLKYIKSGVTEVTIEEIYKAGITSLSESNIKDLVNAEIKTEIEFGFIFEPVFKLIQEAKNKNLKVIIVSDTYLSKKQLGYLLGEKSKNLIDMIDEIYTSSEISYSKANGLWPRILPINDIMPRDIIHIGDNLYSDYVNPIKNELNAIHFIQNTDKIESILDDRTNAGNQLIPSFRSTKPIPSYFHGIFAAKEFNENEFTHLGYTAIGPVMYAFSLFLKQALGELSINKQSFKIAFLMRDGYLPMKAYETLQKTESHAALDISRFTSIAASLTTEESIFEIFKDGIHDGTAASIMRQLLIPENIIEKYLLSNKDQKVNTLELIDFIKNKDITNLIYENSSKFRKRLIEHIKSRTGVKENEKLILVDLGYNGTVQNRLAGILKKELLIDLFGIYLISNEKTPSQADRFGLINHQNIDVRATESLLAYIATLEMMCTNNLGSTIDYTDSGDPIRKTTKISKQQSKITHEIQVGCLEFISDVSNTPQAFRPVEVTYELSNSAALDIARLIYFPTKTELLSIEKFNFDWNLGSDRHAMLFNTKQCIKDLRKYGLSYVARKNTNDQRMSYPLEIRKTDLFLTNYLFNYNRFGLNFKQNNTSYDEEFLKIILINEDESNSIIINLTKTYEGFFLCTIPRVKNAKIGVLIGERYKIIQISEISDSENLKQLSRETDYSIDGATRVHDDIYSLSNNSFLHFSNESAVSYNEICFVFRPLAYRDS
jgi:predicted HAD superfamily hydrolase